MTGINRFSQASRFLRVSRLLLWTIWVIYRERQRVISARQRGDRRARPNIQVLIRVLTAYRETALKLGVLLIKLGQFLSARADLLPEEALEVLADLQDQVPPAPFEDVLQVLQQELGRPVSEVFSHIESTCTAAASLGQVHRAVLAATGQTVAVKIQRPHIEQLVRLDLSTLKFVIGIINRVAQTEFIDLLGLYQEFKRTIYEELDYVAEAANARRFTDMFADDPTVYIPQIVAAHTSRRVLVLQWVDGIKVNDYAALDQAGIDRTVVAERIVHAYLHQLFVASFYHADPHPGNIFVTPGDDYGPRIHLVDFGMVGTLSDAMQKAMKDLLLAYLGRDGRALVDALGRLGFIGRGADIDAIERAVGLVLDRYYGMSMGQARDLDLREVASEVEDLLYGQPFQVPTRFAYVGRAIGTLVGVTTGLAPSFNLVDSATPYARRFLGLADENAMEIVRQVFGQAVELGGVLVRLPKLLERVASKLERGSMEIAMSDAEPRRGRRRRVGREPASNGWSWTLALCAQMGAGVALLMAHQPTPGWFCLSLAGLTTLRTMRRD